MIACPSQAASGMVYFTAVVEPINTSLPITYTWEATSRPPITGTHGLSDTVAFGFEMPGNYTVTVTASNQYGWVMDTQLFTIKTLFPPNETFLPLVNRSGGVAGGMLLTHTLPASGVIMVAAGVYIRRKSRILQLQIGGRARNLPFYLSFKKSRIAWLYCSGSWSTRSIVSAGRKTSSELGTTSAISR